MISLITLLLSLAISGRLGHIWLDGVPESDRSYQLYIYTCCQIVSD